VSIPLPLRPTNGLFTLCRKLEFRLRLSLIPHPSVLDDSAKKIIDRSAAPTLVLSSPEGSMTEKDE